MGRVEKIEDTPGLPLVQYVEWIPSVAAELRVDKRMPLDVGDIHLLVFNDKHEPNIWVSLP